MKQFEKNKKIKNILLHIENLLIEKDKKYSKNGDCIETIKKLNNIIYNTKEEPSDVALRMCLHKLARITTGDKDYLDNYYDLIGYAILALAYKNN